MLHKKFIQGKPTNPAPLLAVHLPTVALYPGQISTSPNASLVQWSMRLYGSTASHGKARSPCIQQGIQTDAKLSYQKYQLFD
jgi:hypothetical protein